MTQPLQDTVALVTGASSGIGEATARELSRCGAAVAIAARRKDRLDDLAQHIHDDGGLAFAVEADVSDQRQVHDLVAQTVDHFGRLDTVINNAGVMLLGPIEDAPTEEWERMIDINLKGLLYVAHAVLPHLLQAAEQAPRHVADIVNVRSVAGRIAGRTSGRLWPASSVSTAPGSTSETRTWRRVTSWRSDSLNAPTPNFVAL